MPTELGKAAIYRLIAGRAPVPNLVDKFLPCDKFTIAACKGYQDFKDHGFRSFLMITGSHSSLAGQNLPVPYPETLL
jgi:hypothetical protein